MKKTKDKKKTIAPYTGVQHRKTFTLSKFKQCAQIKTMKTIDKIKHHNHLHLSNLSQFFSQQQQQLPAKK